MKRVPREVWWLVGIIVVMVIIAGVMTSSNAALQNESNPSRSTYSNGVGGLRALYLTLEQLGYHVSRWRRPIAGRDLPNGVFVLVEPIQGVPIASSEWDRLYRWIADGNTAFLASEHLQPGGSWDSGGGDIFSTQPPRRYALPVQPSYLAQKVAVLRSQARNRLSLEPPSKDEVSEEWRQAWGASVPAFADTDGLVVTYTPIGKGRLVTICSPWSLSNEGLAQADNLPFVLNVLGAPKGTQVVFDEYHHGYGENVAWALTPTWARWALAQFAFGLRDSRVRLQPAVWAGGSAAARDAGAERISHDDDGPALQGGGRAPRGAHRL